MTFYQFNALDEMDQAEAIWEKSVFLKDRTEGEYKYILYQVDSFYVELHYNLEHNVLKRGRVFANPDHLQPYLEQMTITL